MDSFAYCVQYILELEGSLSCDALDHGGETNHGISSAAYPTIDVAALSLEEAIVIYKRDYWDPCRCGLMAPGLALMVFDGAVNQGRRRCVEWLQTVLDVHVDGYVGDETMAALSAARDPVRIIKLLGGMRAIAYMQASVQQRKRFGEGWRNRLVRLYLESLLLARSGTVRI